MTGLKRKSSGSSLEEIYSNKSRSKPLVEAKVDPIYGQRSAIPGLDDDTIDYGEDTDLNYDVKIDALAYLRAVRQEASAIPNLLIAPRTPSSSTGRDVYENGIGDFRGYYADKAYVARQSESEAAEEEDPQLACCSSILARYRELRLYLQKTPPQYAIDRLGSDHPTTVERMHKDLTRWWIRQIRSVNPKPAQIASFNKGSVLRLLRLLTQGTLLKRGLVVDSTISRWTWSLLARLPERGELSSEEIGVVRELGKKAVLVGVGLRQREEWDMGLKIVEQEFEGEEEEDGDVVNEDEISLEVEEDDVDIGTNESCNISKPVIAPDKPRCLTRDYSPAGATMQEEADLNTESLENSDHLTQAKARILAQLSHASPTHAIDLEKEEEELPVGYKPIIRPAPSDMSVKNKEPSTEPVDPRLNLRATVDMILTIAGEVYGQRDLLKFRGQ
ncbi:hypothetical protein QTJ16_004724 [Diplocarpon rosae]|uniref:Uncharacterized protein n=1 Tax=Diplocarpon rosae TaxID=946125 RepID=A0AAD9WBG4_9HELO|nr:hypothetical protein QTJ16_004724 [Diplocarpon rosae]PBP18819.1 hypothetical protein BUE80_DR010498 [Diplocarpon rosae]